MKFNIAFERIYPHTVATVWRAVTDPNALGQWLMETDFSPEEGRDFRMWCENADGSKDLYLCKVISIEPQTRMLWSWVQDGRQDQGETYVEFVLAEVEEGARLTIRHSGDRDPSTIEAFRSGWPHKLGELDEVLARGL